MSFSSFKEIFDAHYENEIHLFIDELEEAEELGPCPFKFEFQEDLDVIAHDSYGNEDSSLKRICYIPDFNIYVMFWGNRSSYQGEEWYGYKEVIKTEKTISVWTESS